MSNLRGLFPQPIGESARVTLTLGNPADYIDRGGYEPTFVMGRVIPMPIVPDIWLDDVVPVDDPARVGHAVFDLRYVHFSVVMSRSRRMPYYSCANIDGKHENSQARADTAWRYDPRIPIDCQLITDGIYGRVGDGLFSRGHMTRREDPNWGDDATAAKSDADTFHVTNACPQMQPFNAPIWLALEEHVKKHAWQDDMRVSVFTGPVFDDANDPWYRPPGQRPVQVPAAFWKVVVFRHDDSGDLAATAYRASQATQLPQRNRADPQFVFGQFEEYQMRIEDLEALTALDFGPLRDVDVLRSLDVGFRISHGTVADVILSS